MNTSQKKYLVIIAGPTAVGKTATAIEVAKYFKTEIISADSRQFYREMNIGTAKPSPAELKAVQHHFINNLSIHDSYSVGKYESEVLDFLKVFYKKQDIVAALLKCACKTKRSVVAGVLPDKQKSDVVEFLHDLAQMVCLYFGLVLGIGASRDGNLAGLQRRLVNCGPKYDE